MKFRCKSFMNGIRALWRASWRRTVQNILAGRRPNRLGTGDRKFTTVYHEPEPGQQLIYVCFLGEFRGKGSESRRSAENPGMVISAPRETCRSVVESFEDSRRTRQKAGVSLWL